MSHILVANSARHLCAGCIGDAASNPRHYFPWLQSARQMRLDCIGVGLAGRQLRDAKVIVCGGLVDRSLLCEQGIQRLVRTVPKERLVLWGAGFNQHGTIETHIPAWLEKFGLVGLRDASMKHYDWVPFPSVMHRRFDATHYVTCDAVIFNSQGRPRQDIDPDLPRMSDGRWLQPVQARWAIIGQAINFIGSAEVVLTDNQYGLAWATWLGRRVVFTRYAPSEIRGWPYPPAFLRPGETWRQAAGRARIYAHALRESRRATTDFAGKVRAFLDI